ncbi:MAG: CinA family nicotinamide mononucleotide deamidase-related protein [Pirellulaceae bacterium]
MNAEVIAVGDELISGQRLDTNSQWLSQQLAELGIPVTYHTTVGDDREAHVRVFRQAFERADVVICTGGLGPTADDLTRQALATATDTELVSDADSLAHIRALFARRKRAMPERNVVQAMFPVGSQPVPNEHGTAPGIEMHVARRDRSPCYFFALPGVPAEMRAMWRDSVTKSLAEVYRGPRQVIRHKRVKCFGVGESDLEQMLPDLIRRGRVPTVGITASRTTITLCITARAESEDACQEQMAPTLTAIHGCLGDLVYGYDDDEIQDAVVRLLRQGGNTLATAEVGTGGTLADWLSEADEGRSAYVGGVVVRCAKSDSLEVGSHPHAGDAVASTPAMADTSFVRPFATLEDEAESVARHASLVRERWHSDFGLAVGAFPDSDSAETAPGDVFIGLASARRVWTKSFPFAGHPQIVRVRAAKQALNNLRLWLLEELLRGP